MRVLSPRLAAVAEMLPRGAAVADIGTDHARLPVWLVLSGRSPRCVATDLRDGPARLARAEVAAAGVQDRVDVRVGPGLQPLRRGEVPAIAVAGMGGATIVAILRGPPGPRELGIGTLVLQANTGAGLVRRWLRDEGWSIVAEDLVADAGRLYPVIGAVDPAAGEPAPAGICEGGRIDAGAVIAAARSRGMPPDLVDLLWDAGPLLWRARHPLLPEFAVQETGRLRRAARGAAAGRSAAQRERAEALLRKVRLWEELLAWRSRGD